MIGSAARRPLLPGIWICTDATTHTPDFQCAAEEAMYMRAMV